jgi:predicted GH43/DUF377 family glycosyl hydrolase
MLKITKHGIILSPSSLYFENQGVFNPGIIVENDIIHLFYRALSNRNHSCIGYCRMETPLKIKKRSRFPLLKPLRDYEAVGIEDPRIVKIDDLFYLTYTAFDGINALGALALSTDLHHFYRWGLLVPLILKSESLYNKIPASVCANNYTKQLRSDPNSEFIWDKNVVFFPRRINGKLCFLHRIKPCILVTYASELSDINTSFWNSYLSRIKSMTLDCEKLKLDKALYVGSGCPPIEIEKGWILVYHAVYEIDSELVYKAHCCLLDINEPQKVIAYLPYSLLEPELEWEKNGNIKNVVFPTGALIKDGFLFIYYGGADKQIGCASVDLINLTNEFTYIQN